MASTTTTNSYVGPQDGWVQIAATAALFTRVSGYPHTHPYQLFYGSAAPSLLPAQATGTVVFAGLPTANQHVIIGTETYVFKASAALPFEVTIGADATAMGDNLVATITANSTLITGVNATGTVTVTAILGGTQGNYAMTENATNVTVGAATMTGGAAPPLGVTICHKPFIHNNGTTAQPLWARVVNPVPNSFNRDGRLRLDSIVTA